MIIDLERGDFVEDLFRLPYEFAVLDLLFARELKRALGRFGHSRARTLLSRGPGVRFG